MAKHLLLLAALLSASYAQADNTKTDTQRSEDIDGFTQPLKLLKFNPGLDQREFERATMSALSVYDPLEPINRRIYHFNFRFYLFVFLSLFYGYRYVTPSFLRTGVTNFFNNLGDVPNLLNSLLQLKGHRSLETTGRLLLNTTLGVAGLWDPATAMGLPRQSEDFGQTLGFYGVPGGAYLMLPILGPSNLRDTTGLVVDYGANQEINFLNVPHESTRHPEIWVLGAVDKRYNTSYRYGQFDSPFEYDKLRYIYTEARKLQIAE